MRASPPCCHEAAVITARSAHTEARLLDAADASVIASDTAGCVTHWNSGAQRLFGWAAAEAVGTPLTHLMIEATNVAAWKALRMAAEADESWEGELDLRDRNGTVLSVYVRTTHLRDENDAPAGFVSVAVDISERLESERHLRSTESFLRAVTDSMGEGLITLDAAERVTYMNHAAEAMLGWHMSDVQDQQAHLVVHGMSGTARAFPAARAFTGSTRRPEDVLRAEDTFLRRNGSSLPVTYTLSAFTSTEGDAGSVLVFSDCTALKAEQERTRRELESLKWEARIRDALDGDGFCLFAQPIVEIRTGRVVQHELLLRMRGLDGAMLAPGEFMPVAEASGLIAEIDRWVLANGLALAGHGHAVAINLSAASLGTHDLAAFVETHLRRLSVDPALVALELTETALLDHEREAQDFLERVAALGCRVALDGFGTGYGGFTYIKRFPIDYLKIDREFVSDLATNAASSHVVEAVVALARGFGQQTVAEGVEDRAMLPQLALMGVDLAQGYALGRPQPADEVLCEFGLARSAA
jgi:PAS domain S-box-containing protein